MNLHGRVLGPEPWRTAYVEPSRQPAPTGVGKCRLQHYYQYQVITKPAPPTSWTASSGAEPHRSSGRHPPRGGRLGEPFSRGLGMGWEVAGHGSLTDSPTSSSWGIDMEAVPAGADLRYQHRHVER